MRKQMDITSPFFTLQIWNYSHFVQYTLPKILMHWAERNNQPEAVKSYPNT